MRREVWMAPYVPLFMVAVRRDGTRDETCWDADVVRVLCSILHAWHAYRNAGTHHIAALTLRAIHAARARATRKRAHDFRRRRSAVDNTAILFNTHHRSDRLAPATAAPAATPRAAPAAAPRPSTSASGSLCFLRVRCTASSFGASSGPDARAVGPVAPDARRDHVEVRPPVALERPLRLLP